MRIQAIILFVISLVFIFLAFYFQKELGQFKSLGLLGIFLVNLFGSATVFLPAPAIASVVAGGIVYPPMLVAVVSALGSSIGEASGFLLGNSSKHLFPGVIREHLKYKTVSDIFKKYGVILILVGSFIPNPFFDILGIVAGVLAFSPTRFLILVFIGRLFRDILLAYAGSLI